MAKENLVNVFDLENSYAGGGSFFTPGRYRFDDVYYTMFDFGGKAKPGEEAPALCAELQALDDNGKPVGESKPQFWPIRGEGVELAVPVKGKRGCYASLTLTGKFNTLMKGGEFFMFMEHLRKSEAIDMDQYDNDITVLNDLDAQMELVQDEYQGAAKDDGKGKDDAKEGKKKNPRMVPVVVGPAGKSSSGRKSSSKKDDADERPSRGSKKEKELTPEAILTKYVDEVLGADKEDTTRPLLRMALGKWITGTLELPAETARATQELVNDDDQLAAILESCGWELEKDRKTKEYTKNILAPSKK